MIPMIAGPDNSLHLSLKNYFAWEEQKLEKYELMNSQPYAMGGCSINHSRLAVSLTSKHSSNGWMRWRLLSVRWDFSAP